jgi:hypothetical protein
VYNVYYPQANIPLTVVIMFFLKSKQVSQTTSKPRANSEPREILHEAALEKAKIANAKADATKSQEKAKTECKSVIVMGMAASLATRNALQPIISTLTQAEKWIKELMESLSRISEDIATKAMTEDRIIAYAVRLKAALLSGKVEAKETLIIAQQRKVLTQSVMKNVTPIKYSVKIALKAATKAEAATAAWFRIAASAEPQIMMAAEALPSLDSSIHRTRAKRAASDAGNEIVEAQNAAQNAAEIWDKVKYRTQRTMKAWNIAADEIESAAKKISIAANQMEDTFHELDEANDERKQIVRSDRIKSVVKIITKTATLTRYMIADAVEQIEACERKGVKRAVRSTTKLQSLIYSQEKLSGIQIK